MSTVVTAGVGFVLAGLLGATAAAAETDASPQSHAVLGADRFFRVESQVEKGSGNAISGYVYNAYGLPASRVHILVEGVDGSGKVVSTSDSYVQGIVPNHDRAYFEAPVPPGATTYRARVHCYDWMQRS